VPGIQSLLRVKGFSDKTQRWITEEGYEVNTMIESYDEAAESVDFKENCTKNCLKI